MNIRRKQLNMGRIRPARPGFARIRNAAFLGAVAVLSAAGTAFADDAFEYKVSDAGLQIKAGNLTKKIEVYGDKGQTLRVTTNLNGVSHANHPSISVIAKPIKAFLLLKQALLHTMARLKQQQLNPLQQQSIAKL